MPDGKRLPDDQDGPSIVWEWDDDRPATSSRKKRSIFMTTAAGLRAARLVEKTWGSACATLFEEFRSWLLERRDEKEEILNGKPGCNESDYDPLSSLLSRRDEHYSAALGMFDKALAAIRSPSLLPRTLGSLGAASIATSDEKSKVSTIIPSAVGESNVIDSATPSPGVAPETASANFYHPALSGPGLKRRSEDGEHPEACNAKVRPIDAMAGSSA